MKSQKKKVSLSKPEDVGPQISTQFLLDRNSKATAEALEQFDNLSKMHNNRLLNFVPFANLSANHTIRPPSGFAVQSKRNETPVIGDLFDKKMFQRVVVFELPKKARILGLKEAISEEIVWKNNDKIKALLNKFFKEEQGTNGISAKIVDKKSRETKAWKDEMGNGGSFIGLFFNSERGAYNYENSFYIAAQTYSPSANEEIHQLMEDAAPQHDMDSVNSGTPKVTWEQFFKLSENKDLATLARMCKRNSHRQLAKFVQAIQLEDHSGKPIELDMDVDAFSSEKHDVPWLLHPDISMITNSVELYGQDMVYRNGAVNPSFQKNGVVFSHNPLLGLSILKGPKVEGLAFGGSWEASPQSLGSIPVNTGRQKNNNTLSKEASNVISSNVFTWSDQSTTANKHLRLIPETYRIRNSVWNAHETMIGYDHSNGEIHLKPLVVKIAKPQSS